MTRALEVHCDDFLGRGLDQLEHLHVSRVSPILVELVLAREAHDEACSVVAAIAEVSANAEALDGVNPGRNVADCEARGERV